ncbi:MAG: Asp-tRNA(Asn)/Glu-tRNA(Gln) amidotransferase subunit GatB [Opitutales bacterium]
MEYEAVIGLEVHVQLKTRTKMFTRVPYGFGAEPNTLTDPVIMGLPGTLPVLNKEAIEQTVRCGLLFDAQIADRCKWDRKNYFYPDSPKNYQISQYDQPLCIGGEVEIELPGPSRNVMGEHRRVKLTRAHLEEDVGKLTHFARDSLVDYNRAGAPLLEIVSEPDLFSPDECVAFLNALRMLLSNAGISDCDMEKGQMRCDANVSVRPKGALPLGLRTEMKNLNSVSGVKAAVTYEIQRQIDRVASGGKVVQETRRWNMAEGYTSSMRNKEEAHDYRYFPDPDLMPVEVPRTVVDRLADDLPERPFDTQRRYMGELGLPYTVTAVLCPDVRLVRFFEAALAVYDAPKPIANFIANDLLRELAQASGEGESPMPVDEAAIRPEQVAALARLVADGTISNQMAREIFPVVFREGKDPAVIVEEQGLRQSSDSGEIEAICRQVIEENPKPVEQFKGGNEKAINALKGRVMKATQGKANPQVVDQVLRQLLE